MPKFLSYQRPAPVNKQSWGGKPGVPYGRPGKQAPKPAPDQRTPLLDPKLLEKLQPRSH